MTSEAFTERVSALAVHLAESCGGYTQAEQLAAFIAGACLLLQDACVHGHKDVRVFMRIGQQLTAELVAKVEQMTRES